MSQYDPDFINGSDLDGGDGMQAVENALLAIQSLNAGPTAPLYAVSGTPWLDTSGSSPYPLKVYDGSSWHIVAYLTSTGRDLDDSTSPVVTGGGVFVEAMTVARTVTGFSGGNRGDRITIIVTTSNMTISGTLTRTGMTIPLIAGDVLEFVYDGTNWIQTGGTVGMGVFVPVAPRNQIGDWIASTTTSYTNVNVSDDGVRKGANAVVIRVVVASSSGAPVLEMGETGSASNDLVMYGGGNTWYMSSGPIKLDNNGTFDAKWQGSWTSTINDAFVNGYYI